MIKRIIIPLFFILFLNQALFSQNKGKLDTNTGYLVSEKFYRLENSPEDLLKSDSAFSAFRDSVKGRIDTLLNRHAVTNKNYLADIYRAMSYIQLFEGNYDSALERNNTVCTLIADPAEKLTEGLLFQSIVNTLKETPVDSTENYRETFDLLFSDQLLLLPWKFVKYDVTVLQNNLSGLSRENITENVLQSYGEMVIGEKALNLMEAARLLELKFIMEYLIPVKENTIQLIAAYIEANRRVDTNVWDERTVALDENMKLAKVKVALWDNGADTSVFDQSYGKSFVINDSLETGDSLLPPVTEEIERRLPEVLDRLKGYLDMKAAVNSTEAAMIKNLLSSRKITKKGEILKEVQMLLKYIRGTYLTGIITDGNPSVKIYPLRFPVGDYSVPADSLGIVEYMSRLETVLVKIESAGRFIKQNRIRIAGITWDISRNRFKKGLGKTGISDSVANVKADSLYTLFGKKISGLIKNNKETLFISSFSDFNNDISENEYIPSSLAIPNLLVVGTVDKSGYLSPLSDPSIPEIFASGISRESVIPGGEYVELSGNPVSAAEVINLAAKVLALNPGLIPEEIKIKLISNAEFLTDEGILLLDPGMTIDRILK